MAAGGIIGNLMFAIGFKLRTNELDRAEKKIGGLSGGVKKLGFAAVAAGAAVGTAMIGVGKAAWDAGKQAERSFKIIRAGSGATGDVLDGLMDSYRNVGKQVSESLDDVATVIADLNTRTGAVGKPLEDLSVQILQVERLTGTAASNMVTSATRAMGDWGISMDKSGEMMDKLFYVSQSTGIGMDSLANKMVQFGAPLRQMGFDFDQSAAMLGKWEKEGVNAELVMGSMRIALGKMAKNGVKDTKKGFAMIVEQIESAQTVGEATALAMEAFGARAGPDMAAAIREGRFAIDDLIVGMQGSAGIIAQNADETMTLSEKMARMRNRITVALEPLGEKLMSIADKAFPYFEAGLDFIVNTVEKLSGPVSNVFTKISDGVKLVGDWFSKVFSSIQERIDVVQLLRDGFESVSNVVKPMFGWLMDTGLPALKTGLSEVGGWVLDVAAWFKDNWSSIEPVVITLTAAIVTYKATVFATTATKKAFTAATKAMTAASKIQSLWTKRAALAQAGLNRVMSLNPIGLVVTVLVALGTAFVIAYKKSETFRNIVNAAWDGVKRAVSAVLNFFTTTIPNVFNSVVNWAKSAWENVKNTTTSIWNAITDALSAAWDTITGAVSSAASAVWEKVTNAWDNVKSSIGSAMDGVKSLMDNAWDTIVGAVTGVGDSIVSKLSGAWAAVKNSFSEAINWIINKFNSMIEGVNGISIKNPFTGSVIASVNIPLIPTIDGSHRTGLDRVPWDGYIAELHKGEGVLTAAENKEYQESKGATAAAKPAQSQSNMNLNIHVSVDGSSGGRGQDVAEMIAAEVARQVQEIIQSAGRRLNVEGGVS